MILRQPPVHGFDGVGGVDDLSDLLGEGEERAHVVPVSAPLLADRGILFVPALGEAIQRGLGLLQRSGLVDRPEVLATCLRSF